MMGDLSAAQRYDDLLCAVHDLRDRGLYSAAQWAAEQLAGISPEPLAESQASTSGRLSRSAEDDHPLFLLAKSYFDMKEYRRAASFLTTLQGAKALFLRNYSLYLAGERRKEEERIEKAGVLGKADVKNAELDAIEASLREAAQQGQGDPFCDYLLGLVLADRSHKDEAREVLVRSVTAYPCNWAAWQALQTLCLHTDDVSSLPLPQHWARDFFLASLCLELQHNAEALSRLQTLNQLFPHSEYVAVKAAAAHYNMRNFDEAQQLYEDVISRDPYRIEGMDVFSNILYVKEADAALSHLAHSMSLTDKYRPETCCIIGNYYSLKGQHERAVEYFRRALKLHSNYLAAWTLMGHEYVELKNAQAAVDAYRRAVELNPRDYRAWYGLGQTYELLLMPYYALYYFRRATLLRPDDARMWCALGQCYENEQLGNKAAAIRCYRRAVDNNDREGVALPKLAKLHEACGELGAAAHYYALNLQRLDAEAAVGADVADALLFLAEYAKATGALPDAESYCQRLMDYGGVEKQRAKALLREIRDMQRHDLGGLASGYGTYDSPGFPSFPALPPLPAPAVAEAPRRASAVDARAVELVASQADVEHAVALAALQRHNGDVMRAIMVLTTM